MLAKKDIVNRLRPSQPNRKESHEELASLPLPPLDGPGYRS